jgi:hypothetical protein
VTAVAFSSTACEQRAEICETWDRAAAMFEGLTWEIERNPIFYPEVPGTAVRCAAVRPFPEVPVVRCYYNYDAQADKCEIVEITFTD